MPEYVTLLGIFIKDAGFFYLEDFIAVAASFLAGVPLLTRILKLKHNDKHEKTLNQVLSWFE